MTTPNDQRGLTDESREFASDPINHAIYCAYSQDHLHEAPCDCDLDKALTAIEAAAGKRAVAEALSAFRDSLPTEGDCSCCRRDRDFIESLTATEATNTEGEKA